MNITAANNLVLTVKDHHFVQVPNAAMNCRSCHQDDNQKEPGMPLGAANNKMPGFVWHFIIGCNHGCVQRHHCQSAL